MNCPTCHLPAHATDSDDDGFHAGCRPAHRFDYGLKLSPAQISALECRDDPDADALGETLRRAWIAGRRTHLRFDEVDRVQLGDDLTEASNAEDAQAQEAADPAERSAARLAAWSLAIVSVKVICSPENLRTARARHAGRVKPAPRATDGR